MTWATLLWKALGIRGCIALVLAFALLGVGCQSQSRGKAVASLTAERDNYKAASDSLTTANADWQKVVATLQADIAKGIAERERIAKANERALLKAQEAAEKARNLFRPPATSNTCKAALAQLDRLCPELARY